jgi:hypothetical protein
MTGKISGPLPDRIHINVRVPAIAYTRVRRSAGAEPSADIRSPGGTRALSAAGTRTIAGLGGFRDPLLQAVPEVAPYRGLDRGGTAYNK